MRYSPVDIAVGKVLNYFVATPDQQHALGTRTDVVSYDYDTTANVPNGGGGEALYVKATGTFAVGRLVCIDKDWTLLDAPNTANTGRPVFVCMQAFSSTNQYGWVLRSGIFPVSFAVAATVGPVYIGGAGQATPTLAGGKQLLNATTLIAAAGTFTRTVKTVNGSPYVTVMNGVQGIYPGLTPSGTGIAASTVSSIDPDGRTLKLTANATASGTVTVTFTHTGFGIVHFSNPCAQGNIT